MFSVSCCEMPGLPGLPNLSGVIGLPGLIDVSCQGEDMYVEGYEDEMFEVMDTGLMAAPCSICLENCETDTVQTRCCQQPFHRDCIYEWIEDNPTCPLCRSPIQ